jgi:hypothetical protein
MPTCAPNAAYDQLYFVWDSIISSKRKSTGSDDHLAYGYHENYSRSRWDNLSWSHEPNLTTISSLALSASASTRSCDQLYSVWDSSKGKSTGSGHPLAQKWLYNLVCILRRSKLQFGLVNSITICASAGASDQVHLVWDSNKGKSTGSDHLLV